MSVEDIGNNSNRRMVAAAVSTLQDSVGATEVDILAAQGDATQALADAAAAQVDADAAQVDATQALSDAADAQADIDAQSDIVATETLIGTYLTAPMYRKVIAISAAPNANTVTFAHGITGLLVLVSGYGSLKAGADIIPVPYVDSSLATNNMSFAVNATVVTLISGQDLSSFAGHVVLEYTKS